MKTYDWLNYNQYWYRSALVWLVSVILLFIFMSIPMKKLMFSTQQPLLIIELDKSTVISSVKSSATEILEELNSTPTTQQKPIIEVPLKQKPLNKPNKNVKLTDNTPELIEQKNVDIESKTDIEPPLPKSSIIMNSAFNNRKDLHVGKDFQVKSKNIDDFINKKVIEPEWNTVTKWINEDVDKPSVAMRFYSPGIAGSTERFFDKITIKKTFTTKYGTKIHCALIGLIGVCGWK